MCHINARKKNNSPHNERGGGGGRPEAGEIQLFFYYAGDCATTMHRGINKPPPPSPVRVLRGCVRGTIVINPRKSRRNRASSASLPRHDTRDFTSSPVIFISTCLPGRFDRRGKFAVRVIRARALPLRPIIAAHAIMHRGPHGAPLTPVHYCRQSNWNFSEVSCA